MQGGVDERFLQRLVGVFVFHIFADDADEHFSAGIVGIADIGAAVGADEQVLVRAHVHVVVVAVRDNHGASYDGRRCECDNAEASASRGSRSLARAAVV